MTQPAPQSDSRTTQPASIPLGATVYGQDNARFGQVAGSYRDYLIVERGFFMPVDYYVPLRAIRRVEGAVVTLGITRDAALTQGWEKAPFTAETGPRRSRRPAVSSETPAARTGTDRPEELSRSAWPAANPGAGIGAARPTESSTTDEDARTTSTGPTASGNAPLFSDSYAIGVNTDSYQALEHHSSSPAVPDASPAESPVSMDAPADAATPSAGPVVPARGTVAPLANAAACPDDGSDGVPDTQSDAPEPGASLSRRAAEG